METIGRRNMLKKILGLIVGARAPVANAQSKTSPFEDAFFRQLAEKSKTDPLIGAKIGKNEILQRLLDAMKTDRGVHIESLLCALGSLAGYACQASVRAQAVARGLPETALLVSAETKDGNTYYFGDNLNKPLAESQYSVWGIAGGGAQQYGCNALPDLTGIFKHVTETGGTPAFGKPRVPDGHAAHDLPINYVKTLWPALFPTIQKFCSNPEHWPVLLALSIQDAIGMGKQTLDPCIALQIVMESAVPMSKVKL